MYLSAQVEVQTQIVLWSDPVERTSVCSQTEITGSGRKFERTTVWSMVWRWSDQSSFWSEKSGAWSGDGLIRGPIGLKSLIIGGFERTLVWSEATSSAIGSDHNLFERIWIWSEMFSNAVGSDQGPFRAPHFFIFCVFYWEATIEQRSDQKLIQNPIALIKKGVQLIAKAGPLQRKFWSTGDHDVFPWKAV